MSAQYILFLSLKLEKEVNIKLSKMTKLFLDNDILRGGCALDNKISSWPLVIQGKKGTLGLN